MIIKVYEIFGELKFLCFHLHLCSLGKFVIFHDIKGFKTRGF